MKRVWVSIWQGRGRLYRWVLVYAIFLCLLALSNHLIAERHPLTTLLAYIPQWPFLLPVVLFFVIALVRRRKKILLATLALALFWVIAFGDVPRGMGGASDHSLNSLRVLTWNVHHDKTAIRQFTMVIGQENPDVLCLQEANNIAGYPQVWQMLQKQLESDGVRYEFIAAGDLAIGVRSDTKRPIKIASWKYRPLRVAGWRNHLLEVVVTVEGQSLTLFTAHFDRFARPQSLEALRHENLSLLREESQSRAQQATDTLAWISGRTTPNFIFTGDLNTPPHGRLYRRFTTIATDAYAASAPPFFGYTFPSDFPQIRIDHVFCGGNLRPVTAHIPSTTASDHRPIVADISL
jgi:vancomycin resistance protein VanJ